MELELRLKDIESWKGTPYYAMVKKTRIKRIKNGPIIQPDELNGLDNIEIVGRVDDKYISIFGAHVRKAGPGLMHFYSEYYRMEYTGDVDSLRVMLNI